MCVKSRWFICWITRPFLNEGKILTHKHNRTFPMCEEWVVSFLDEKIFLRRAKKIHLWGSKWNFLTCMDLFIYFLDEKFVVNEGQNQGCELTHGLFMLGGSKRWFVIWMTISFLGSAQSHFLQLKLSYSCI